MPREYRNQRNSYRDRRNSSKSPSTLTWILLGLTPGIILITLSYIDRFNDKKVAKKSQDTISFLSDSTVQNKTTTASAKPEKPEQSKQEKPDKKTPEQKSAGSKKNTPTKQNSEIEYKFFTDLKNDDEIVTEKQTEKTTESPNPQTANKTEPANNLAKAPPSKQNLKPKTSTTKTEKPKQPEKPDKTDTAKLANKSRETKKTAPKKPARSVKTDKLALANKPAKTNKPASGLKPNYLLQTGSFANKSHADKRQQQLAKIGFQSRIIMVTVKGRQWYRVNVGPVGRQDLKKNIQQLKKHKISAIAIKLK